MGTFKYAVHANFAIFLAKVPKYYVRDCRLGGHSGAEIECVKPIPGSEGKMLSVKFHLDRLTYRFVDITWKYQYL